MQERRNREPQRLGEILRDAARADLEPEQQTPLSVLLQGAPKPGQPAPEVSVDDVEVTTETAAARPLAISGREVERLLLTPFEAAHALGISRS